MINGLLFVCGSGAAYHLMTFAMLDTLIGSASFNIVGTFWLADSGACVAEAPSLYHLALGENILFHLLFDGGVLWATGVLYLVWIERRTEKAQRLLAHDATAASGVLPENSTSRRSVSSSGHRDSIPEQYIRPSPSGSQNAGRTSNTPRNPQPQPGFAGHGSYQVPVHSGE
jgi:hypothetical protein